MMERQQAADLPSRRGEVVRKPVQSLGRALGILTILGTADRPLPLTEIARTASLSYSTTHRLLTTMQEHRYVRFDKANRRWAVGVQAYRTGLGFLRTRSLVEAANPPMQRLVQDSREMVTLAVAKGSEVAYLHRIRGLACHGDVPEMPSTPFHCSAVGKALMSGMMDAEIDALVERRGLPPFTKATIDSRPELRREINRIRTLGYAVDREERVVGMRCVAALIHDENGRAMGALSLAGAAGRIAEGRVAELGAMVRRSAVAVTRDVGGRLPS